MCFLSSGLNDMVINGRASVLSARPVWEVGGWWVVEGRGVVMAAVSGDLII